MIQVSKLFFFVTFSSFFFSTQVFGQSIDYVCPDYFFGTDLAKGASHEDVKVIQEILNSDKRTIVAYSGPGSKGRETGFFGAATSEALKRFQALFIEYIGVANGKFGPKTRTTMNAVCKGPFFTGAGKIITEFATTTRDTVPPVVAVAAPYSTEISQSFRAYIGSNEAIKTPTLDSLIIFNATAGDIRKVSSTTYSFSVVPNQDAKGDITLQFEADAIQDLAGNKNENATNEWVVKILGTSGGTTTQAVVVPEIEIPDIELPVVTPTVSDCSNVSSVKVTDYNNPCYGRVSTDFGNQAQAESGGGGGGGGGIGEMLQGLLKGLMSALGGGAGGKSDGGSSGGPSIGDCSKLPTIQLVGKRGQVVGRADMTANPGMGDWTGLNIGPPGPIYGFKLYPDAKSCRLSCPGSCLGACCKPESDMTGQPVLFTVPPQPSFHWAQ